MPDLCRDYEVKGYCLLGQECPGRHGDDSIHLDVSDYQALVDAIQKAATERKLQQNELKRKQTGLLMNLVQQQRALIEKIELCSDETEKQRMKTALEEMSQKTKDWIEAQTQQQQTFTGTLTKNSSSSLESPSTSVLLSGTSTDQGGV